MPYNRNNYSFVIDSSFQPFSMQEMLQPLVAYKSAYEQAEQQYEDIASQDIFKYLNNLPEGSKSRAIYENYMTELNKQSDDLSRNGLNMGNRRALLNLRKRYKSEIGRLEAANTALQEEKKLRRQMNAKDSSMLYATDNMSLDDFLDASTPNLYNISGTELYTRGAAAGKSASSRVYSAGDEGSTLGGYYRDFVTRQGYNPDKLNQFQQEMLMNDFTRQVSVLPELQQAAQQILDANGVTQNLTGENLRRAQQQVIRGIVDGSVYDEKHNPTRDLGKRTAAERDSSARGWASHNESVRMHNLQLKMAGYDENGVYHPENDQTLKKAEAVAKAKGAGSKSNGRGSSTMKDTQTEGRVRFTWNGNNPNDTNGDADDDYNVEAVASDDTEHPGVLYSYDRLPTYVKKAIAPLVGDGKQHLYDYYFKPYEGGIFNDGEASIELVPRKIITQNRNQESSDSMSEGSSLNDIPE